MMKKFFLVLLVLFFVGCSYAGKEPWHNYLHVPRTWLMDPHFAEYKKAREALELEHINGSCTYAVYQEKMKKLNEKYEREVQAREKSLDLFNENQQGISGQ